MRKLWIVPLLLFLTGCGASAAMTVASLALDGVSLMASGKTVADHALSFVTQQDCAIWRAVTQGDIGAICRLPVEDEDAIVTAAADEPAEAIIDEPAAAARPVESAEIERVAAMGARSLKSRGELAFADGIGGAPLFSFGLMATPPAAPLAASLALLPVGYQVPTSSVPPALINNRKATYLVAGSFRNSAYARDLANRLIMRQGGNAVMIAPAMVAEVRFHRVVTGPLGAGEMHAARDRLASTGHTDAWAISLCTADLSAPPCAAPRMQVTLDAPARLALGLPRHTAQ